MPLHIQSPDPLPGVKAGVSYLHKLLLDTRSLGDSTLNLAEHNIRTTSHAVQLYEALTNLYRLAGPNPFDTATGKFTETTLQKLSAVNGLNLSTWKDPMFFSDLRLGVPMDMQHERPPPAGAPRWQSIPPPSPSSESETQPDSHVLVSPMHADDQSQYASDGDGSGDPAGVASEGDDGGPGYDDYDMDDDEDVIIGAPEYHAGGTSDFTSSGSLGSTSSSESDVEK